MNGTDQDLDFILERGHATHPIMVTLSEPPYSWTYGGLSPNNYLEVIGSVEAQQVTLATAEAVVTEAGAAWDADLDILVAEARLGTRLGRLKWAGVPAKFRLFEGLRYTTTGRDGELKQVVAFEAAWKKGDAAWVFKPGLTLAQFTTKRAAISTTRVVAHANAVAEERGERAVLHELANQLEAESVKWYDAATATFPEDSVAGQLVRTIPTTYDPNRVPGRLRFTAHFSTAPNQSHLLWRASRGKKFYISARGPGQEHFEVILDGVTDREWLGLGVTPGEWAYKGYATNEHGTGEPSETVHVDVLPAMEAAA